MRDNKQFRILYAIGIFLIVAGHYGNGGVDFFFGWFKPYAFHVALFVFCSGYFYNSSDEDNVLKAVGKRVKKLIIPLYLWNLFYGVLVLLFNKIGFGFSIQFDWHNLLIAPINNGHQFMFNEPSWFIMPLFMVQIFVILLRKFMNAVKIKNELVIFVVQMILGMAGVGLASQGYYTGWWLVLTRVSYFLPFYACGYLYRNVLEEKLDKISTTVYMLVVFGIQAVVMIVYGDSFAYTPSWCNNFDNCFTPILIGILGIAFWVRVAKLLVPIAGDSRIVKVVAENTFSIMMHHYLGLLVVKCGFALIRHLDIACRSFDINLFMTNPYYVYIPFGIRAFAIFMVLGSMGVAILLGKVPLIVKRLSSRAQSD